MNRTRPLIKIDNPEWAHRIKHLFDKMDGSYAAAASSSGFTCAGCEDNCCLSLFYHHTLMELFYLKEGLATLPEETLATVTFRAQEAAPLLHQRANGEREEKVPCPLMEEGQCILYEHRPMVCRLHGVAHILERPDGTVIDGPGCARYEQASTQSLPLNRTPLYREMAILEKELREETGFADRLRLTIAEMILL
ncbi:YkgJ family cysteine cluster protein [Desulfoluna butyratoxydans]|uniref:Putative zinc- or iron-chelating domain containing protein n=1 Tax=Desulfoluna butyratoxydans TaxID=231438 RepID=A0A4U8YKI8_9BACT|nr:YkgJ family cysteine cluster protein [Desulfoluna butyratoxydans]VFQ43977.1 putative zinc- or iron-chelating domain containing protein [Desulfoluna butyratoxydans]